MADSMLAAVRDKAAAYAAMMAEVLRLDVEVVDDSLVRVAGTGVYRDGARLVSDGAVYRQILRSGKPAIIHNPRKHELCSACPGRDRCLEKLEICFPIQYNGRYVGAVGMVCSNGVEKNILMENIRAYIGFIGKVCDMLSAALDDYAMLQALQSEAETLRAQVASYAEEGYSGEICALEQIERREIEKAIKRFGSDTKGKKAAAEALGIGIATLYRKLNEF